MASEPADAAATGSDDVHVTFNIKAANDQKFVLTLPTTTTTADLKTKLSGSEYADIPTERIRLIYSGRVLKDADTLQGAKIKDGHTIHMVKGAASNARQAPAAQNTSGSEIPAGTGNTASPAANVPTSFATGTGNNPLAGLTGARYAGFAGLPNASMFGADGGMGAAPDPSEMLRMMDDPNFLSQMSEMMNNPDFLRMMESNPMLQNNPAMRQMLRDPEMRRMMFNPQMLRMQMEMQRRMGGGGMPGMGGAASSFPAPGVTDTTPGSGAQDSNTTTSQTGAPAGTTGQSPAAAANPFASLFGGAGGMGMGQQANPFAALMGGAGPGAGAGGPNDQASADAMRNLMQSMQAMGGLPGMYGQEPAAPPDNRPPEERYADQLRQLNDMGFFEFERNVQALRRSGGSVQGAIEYLLSNP